MSGRLGYRLLSVSDVGVQDALSSGLPLGGSKAEKGYDCTEQLL